MRKTLLFIFLLVSEIVAAQSTGRTIVVDQVPGSGFQFADQRTKSPVNEIFWDEAEPFVNGFSRVLRNNKFSFVDNTGRLIAAVEFDAARNFSNKLAAVKKGTKWGFINESGKMVIPFKYEVVYDFKETVTAVLSNNNWLLINAKGDIIKALDISVFYGFDHGIAKIEKDGRKGTINTRGEITLSNKPVNTPVTNRIPYRPSSASSSSVCPDNIDFEFGSFLNWKCFIGRVDSVGTTNVITVNPSPPTNNRHTLYNRVMPSPLDPFGLFPTNPPDGSNFAVRLGNTNIGAQAERIQYPIRVPVNDSNFSIKYDYAVVFEDPGHTSWTQPRFTVRLLDSATNTYVDCASFEYISTSSLPGFAVSTVDTAVIYKPWSTVFVSLRGYAGKTMFLEFTTADCVRRGHWGYAYVDVEKPCGQSAEVQYECTSPNITTLDAPPGFQIYNWWDSTYTILYGTGQHVVLNPGPPVNSTIWLEMVPFNNFGCKDTIPVVITGIFNADFSLSDTVGVCAPHSFTFYNSNLPSSSAIWDFGDGTTGSGDTVTHIYNLPGNYYVTLNVVLPSGCVGTIQKLVTILQPVGSFYFNGAYFCNSQQVRFDAVVNSASDSLFWDFGDGTQLATTQTTVFHTYALPGLYLPYLTVQSSFGCQNTLPAPDTIRIEKLRAGFFDTQVKTCGSTTVNLTDTSYAYFGISDHDWDFGDGTTGSGATVSHTYTATGTYNIQLIITGISGCLDTIVKPVYVVVNEKPVATITGLAVQCQSVPVTFSSSIVSADAINYIHWTSSNGNSGSGNTFAVNFIAPGNYTVQLIVGTVNGCYDTTTHSITIDPTPDVVTPGNQALCNGALTSAVYFTGPVAGTSYSWTNNNTSIGLAATGTGDIASFTAVNNTTAPITATITVSPSANSCPGPSRTFTITVNPTPDVVQPADQVLCNGTNITAINFAGTVSGTVYTWTNNNASIGLAVSGSGNIPSFTAVNNTNQPVTATITVRANANGCSSPAKVFLITVDPTPDVVQPGSQVLCNGAIVNPVNFAGAVSGTTYNWTNNNTSIGLAASGTGDITSFAAVNNTTAAITATITVAPSANGCPGPSKIFTITVNPTPDVIQPADQVLCKDAPTAAIIFAGPVTGTTYTWTNNNTLIGLAASGTGDIPSFTAINNTTQPVTATITVRAHANGCSSPAKIFTITVNPMPAVTQPIDHIYCNGAATNAIAFATAVSGATFNWTNDDPSIGLSSNGSGNIASFAATNNSSAPITATITVSATASGCPGTASTFTITVNPTPDLTQPNDQALCNGSTTGAVSFVSAVAGANFSWTNSNTSIGLAANGSGNIPAFTAINNTNAPVTATISVTTAANGCPGQTKTFTITVNPTADVSQPLSQVLCNGSSAAMVSFTGNVTGTIYNWTNSNTSIGLAASGSGDIPSFTAINTSNVPVTATITVTPIAGTCPGTAKTFTIRVNPTPDVVRPADQTLCNQAMTTRVVFNGSVIGTGYNWTNNNTSIGLAASGTGDIASFTAINTANTISTAMITVTPTANSCPGAPKDFMFVVKPSPAVIQPANQSLCNGVATSAINFAGTQSASTFSWTNNNTSIGLAANGTGDITPFTAINNTSNSITATVTVSASANGCMGPAKNVVITVNPTPSIVATNDRNVCRGSSAQLSATGAAQYSWMPVDGLSCSNCANPVSTPLDTIKYVVTGTSSFGCIGYDSVVLKVIKPFQMLVDPGDTLCVGESIGLKAMQANTYLWSPPAGLNNVNVAQPTATPTVTTTYRVIGYDGYQCFTDTGYVTVIVGPKPTVDIGTDINTQTGTTVTLHPVTQNGPIVNWLWTPATDLSCTDCPAPVASVRSNITYSVKVTNAYGCIATDRIIINVFCQKAQVYIPNAFTPDGDGLNDILMIRGSGISVKTFRVFNRWGELVFERTNFNPNDPKYAWDGKVRGVPASPDVFVYTAEIICDNGITYTYKGNTTVLK